MKRVLMSAAAIAVLVGLVGCHGGLGAACGGGCGTCAAGPDTCQSCGDVGPACNVCATDPGAACGKCVPHVNKMACRKGHTGRHRAPMQVGPPMGSITYPYYTVKGPSDFLATETRPLGP